MKEFTPPPGFRSNEYTPASNDSNKPGDVWRVPWSKDGGHLQDATDEVLDSIWGVPVGRRKGSD